MIAHLTEGDEPARITRITALFGDLAGTAEAMDQTDGLRITFAGHEVIHLRPSGNAPELRCYTEADSAPRATELGHAALAIMREAAQA